MTYAGTPPQMAAEEEAKRPALPPKGGPTRRQRRAYAAVQRKKNRAEAKHACVLDSEAEKLGVFHLIGFTPDDFHAIHRALGEPKCVRCPYCIKGKPFTVRRAAALATFRAKCEQERARKYDEDVGRELAKVQQAQGVPYDPPAVDLPESALVVMQQDALRAKVKELAEQDHDPSDPTP